MFTSPQSPEAVKKLGACDSARKDGRLVETLGRGSSDVGVTFPLSESA